MRNRYLVPLTSIPFTNRRRHASFFSFLMPLDHHKVSAYFRDGSQLIDSNVLSASFVLLVISIIVVELVVILS